MCCCSSNQSAFAWISAILVNIGFISFICWGATSFWPIGFVLSALYTFLLINLAQWLERDTNNNVEAEGYSDVNDDRVFAAEEDDSNNNELLSI